MAFYTNITELPPLPMPGVNGALIFRWTDSNVDVLYQLYINGELAAETQSVGQPKELIASIRTHIVWQVLAIDPEDAGIDYSEFLDITDSQGSRVEIKWPRLSSELEVGSYAYVYGDRATGTIDYTNTFGDKIENFPSGAGNWGFGLGGFGETFGYDGEGLGFGIGSFGVGEFGFDADYVEFKSLPFPPGFYKFDVVQYDSHDNSDGTGNNVNSITVDSMPPAVKSIKVSSYDQPTDVLTLLVTEGTMAIPYGF